VLESGRSDPWWYPEPDLTSRQLSAAEDAARHLLDLGFAPLLKLDTIRELWRRRDRELAWQLARLAGAA
jgi:hypothetical protein